MTGRLLRLVFAIADALLLLLDHEKAQPSYERHNEIRNELHQALFEARR